MIVNFFPTWFRSLYGGTWPNTYCCIDLETTGYSFDRDVITEYGHCLIEDGKVTDRLSLVIDWTDHPVVPLHWLKERVGSLQRHMDMAGKVCHTSIEKMQAEGMKPQKALPFIRDFLATIASKQIPFVLHGGMFDEKMLAGNFIGFEVAKGFSFGDNGWIDTEGVAKASQIPDNPRVHPRRNDTLRDYWHRVKYTKVNGIKSNMDEYCYDRYKLAEQGIKLTDTHAADVDAYCCHLLMQAFAKEIVETPVTPPVFPTADHQESRKPETRRIQPQPVPVAAGRRLRGQRNS